MQGWVYWIAGLIIFVLIVLFVVWIQRWWCGTSSAQQKGGAGCCKCRGKRGKKGKKGKKGEPGQNGQNGQNGAPGTCPCAQTEVQVVCDGVSVDTSAPNDVVTLPLTCPDGFLALGGGGEISDVSGGQVVLETSIPTGNPPNGWVTTAIVLNGNPSFNFDAKVTCVKNSPLC